MKIMLNGKYVAVNLLNVQRKRMFELVWCRYTHRIPAPLLATHVPETHAAADADPDPKVEGIVEIRGQATLIV